MEDKILEMFFERKRWEDALNKGAFKGISMAVLRDLMSPNGRKNLLAQIMAGEYHIERPHTAKIPKDVPGEFRTVFINNDRDRVFLSIVNDLLFDLTSSTGGWIHPQCTSYQKGIGCAKIVARASQMIEQLSGTSHSTIGWKADLSKYFDSVPIQYIDSRFDTIEKRYGKSVIIDIVREYYHLDLFYDSELKQEVTHYQSLKQGCAVASWLADTILYELDKVINDNYGCKAGGYYVRYSDDILFIGKEYEKAMEVLTSHLERMNMKLNPKKVEYIDNSHWFKFLGFSIKGANISLSGNRIKSFVKEITARTIKQIRNGIKFSTALHSVQSWLYYGDGQYSWATGVLKTINVKSDIDTLNGFVLDCLRAVMVGKSVGMNDIGGLGWVKAKKDGCIARGKGRKIRTLREKTGERIDGFYSLGCMRNNLLYGRDIYDSIVRDI